MLNKNHLCLPNVHVICLFIDVWIFTLAAWVIVSLIEGNQTINKIHSLLTSRLIARFMASCFNRWRRQYRLNYVSYLFMLRYLPE